MMCGARLFARVAKPDYTEHRKSATWVKPNVLNCPHSEPTQFHEFILLLEMIHFFLIISHFASCL